MYRLKSVRHGISRLKELILLIHRILSKRQRKALSKIQNFICCLAPRCVLNVKKYCKTFLQIYLIFGILWWCLLNPALLIQSDFSSIVGLSYSCLVCNKMMSNHIRCFQKWITKINWTFDSCACYFDEEIVVIPHSEVNLNVWKVSLTVCSFN